MRSLASIVALSLCVSSVAAGDGKRYGRAASAPLQTMAAEQYRLIRLAIPQLPFDQPPVRVITLKEHKEMKLEGIPHGPKRALLSMLISLTRAKDAVAFASSKGEPIVYVLAHQLDTMDRGRLRKLMTHEQAHLMLRAHPADPAPSQPKAEPRERRSTFQQDKAAIVAATAENGIDPLRRTGCKSCRSPLLMAILKL